MLISEIFAGIKEFKKRSNLKFSYSLNQQILEETSDILPSYTQIRAMNPYEYRIHELVNLRLPRLLKWEDRNSMAFSIESRVPFLDINLIEFMLSLNPEMNLHKGWTKFLFRKAMSKRLPKKITWRKDKKGFETPQEKWMKKGNFHETLKEWSAQKNHPVEEFISTPFNKINKSIKDCEFDSNALFRLFCLDKWLST
jgi:asparagine synthase (glutamine-hydrolysing)